MGKLNAQRQITLTVEQCQKLGVQPGDELESLIIDGLLVLRKKSEKIDNLQDALDGFPVDQNDEDQDWLSSELVGKEKL